MRRVEYALPYAFVMPLVRAVVRPRSHVQVTWRPATGRPEVSRASAVTRMRLTDIRRRVVDHGLETGATDVELRARDEPPAPRDGRAVHDRHHGHVLAPEHPQLADGDRALGIPGAVGPGAVLLPRPVREWPRNLDLGTADAIPGSVLHPGVDDLARVAVAHADPAQAGAEGRHVGGAACSLIERPDHVRQVASRPLENRPGDLGHGRIGYVAGGRPRPVEVREAGS